MERPGDSKPLLEYPDTGTSDPCASGDARLPWKNPNSNVMFGVTVLARQSLLTLALLIEDV